MSPPRILILACGALAREIRAVTRLHQLDSVTLECLPASLHNTPDRIPAALRSRIHAARDSYDRILIGYADCGTAGELAGLCETEGVTMLPGAHCYQLFTGLDDFTAIHDQDPTAFYLTDYLVKHFDRLVIDGLGIAAHPELRHMYFGNYTKLIYLAQTNDPALDESARAAAARLELRFERLSTGYGDLEPVIVEITRPRVLA